MIKELLQKRYWNLVFLILVVRWKKLATKAISRFSMTMTGRILGGYVGSMIPIAATIIGAVAGAWLAGKVEEWWFAEEDKKLEEDKAYNAEIDKQAEQYNLKINTINDYLIKNHYIELRELDDSEAEKLCKEASNLQSDYLDTIKLMLSYENYLKNQNNTNNQILFPNTINSYRKGTIHFSIQAIDEYTRTPIKNAKLQLQNINVGQEVRSDTNGIASFKIDSKENLKPFRAKLISEHYEQCPILDRSIIPNAIRRREKPLELRFLGNKDNLNKRKLNYV